MEFIESSEDSFLSRLLSAERSITIQLTLAFIYMCFWGSYFVLASIPLMKYLKSKPYCEKLVEVTHKRFKAKGLGPFSDDFAIDYFIQFQLIAHQHLISSLLTIPMVFALPISMEYKTTFVRHAALFEMGWEWWDILKSLNQLREVGKSFKKIFILTMVHHLTAQFFAIPMNLNHSDNWFVAYLIFLLQGAAAVAYLGNGYIETLDFETETMKVCIISWFVSVFMFISRGPMFVWCIYNLFPVIKSEGRIFCILFFIAVSGMGLLNLLFIYYNGKKSFTYTKIILKSRKNVKDEGICQRSFVIEKKGND